MTTDPAVPFTNDTPVQESRARRMWTRIGKISFMVVAGVILIAVIATLVLAWNVQRSFPQTSGEITLDELGAAVTVQRDDLGIPTITAQNTHDLFVAQGFVHAQDRFFEMDFRRHVTSGRVAELFGESQAATDAFLRTLGWRDVAEKEVELLDAVTLGYYEAYAEGVNAYLSTRSGAQLSLEYAVLGMQNPDYVPEPWTPADSVAWLKAMAWDLRGNVEDETERALLAAQLDPETAHATLEALYPPYPFDKNPVIVPVISNAPAPAEHAVSGEGEGASGVAAASGGVVTTLQWQQVSSVVEAASALLGRAGEGIGSNSWVVGGALTDTGSPLLANDPHLGASLPSVWYQMDLKCARVTDSCPFNVSGFTFSGLPGVVIGHNDRIAWGFTNLTTDVADLYIEIVDGDSYWRDGVLQPLEVRTETIKVAGADDIELEVRSTVHGPIISGRSGDFTAIAENPHIGVGHDVQAVADASAIPEGEYAVSLRWTALDPGSTAAAIFALDTAQDFADFRRAASLFDVPAQNLIYADVDGNIGYQTPGRLPIRGAGDGWLPQPGWDSAYDWTGFIPFEELPVLYNPKSGFIVTANNAIVSGDYEYFLSRDWDHGYRAARIAHMIERLAANGPITADDMRAMQADNEMWIGKRLAAAMGDIRIEDDAVAEAVALLRTWDAQNSADSAAAAYANALWNRLVQNVFIERETPLPTRSQARLYTVFAELLKDPANELWTNDAIGVTTMEEMLAFSAAQAYDDMVAAQGSSVSRWSWGAMHAITLRNSTFGESGIAPIEALFNRGPFAVGGGSSVVNATGWDFGGNFETTTVPSMRMVVDLADFDASTWNQLTGQSGHAFHRNYIDQVDEWQRGEQQPWPFTPKAIADTTVATLTLRPAD